MAVGSGRITSTSQYFFVRTLWACVKCKRKKTGESTGLIIFLWLLFDLIDHCFDTWSFCFPPTEVGCAQNPATCLQSAGKKIESMPHAVNSAAGKNCDFSASRKHHVARLTGSCFQREVLIKSKMDKLLRRNVTEPLCFQSWGSLCCCMWSDVAWWWQASWWPLALLWCCWVVCGSTGATQSMAATSTSPSLKWRSLRSTTRWTTPTLTVTADTRGGCATGTRRDQRGRSLPIAKHTVT